MIAMIAQTHLGFSQYYHCCTLSPFPLDGVLKMAKLEASAALVARHQIAQRSGSLVTIASDCRVGITINYSLLTTQRMPVWGYECGSKVLPHKYALGSSLP